jgi:hypothetical protein
MILPQYGKKRAFREISVWIQMIAKAATGGNFCRLQEHEKYQEKP